MEDTVFAVSTGQVKAAVSIIRVSGPLAGAVYRMFCKKNFTPRLLELVKVRHPETSEILDIALIVWFPGPHSYTGEDVVEFQIHGGLAVTTAVLSALAEIPGLRLAESGEFTRRAFHNDKLTIESVEGLADLLDADTQFERRQALHRIQGNFGDAVEVWRADLIEARALIEASLDFSDEADVPENIVAEVIDKIRHVCDKVSSSIERSRRQEIYKSGFVVLIAGPPNVGKSTLLNYLVQREVAITSEFAGTTRDIIEVPLDLGGIRVVLVDSAGLRETTDPVEKIGVQKTISRAQDVNIILWLVDDTQQTALSQCIENTPAKLVVVSGKSDLFPGPYAGFPISAVTGDGIDDLLEIIRTEASSFFSQFEGVPSIRQRQLSTAKDLLEHLRRAQCNASAAAFELCAEDLVSGARCLISLVEGTTSTDVLDQVFHRFCLGK